MKIDLKESKTCNLAVTPAQTERSLRPRESVFPSYGWLFLAFLQLATRKIRGFALRRGRHTIVTFSLQPSFFGVI